MDVKDTQFLISSYTLHELIAMAGGETRPGLMGECVVANRNSHMQAFHKPSRIDAFIIGVGTEGETHVSFNLREHCLKKDSLFVFGPKNILQVNSNENFRAHVVAVTPDLLRQLNVDAKHMMPLFMDLASRPCIEMTPAESQTLRSFIALLEQELNEPETDFSVEIINGLIATTIYKIGSIVQNYLTEHPEAQSPVFNRAEEYFRQFVELLGEHFKQERSVNFYARQLCITPKYLTTLIKRISGKSVSAWIDNYVILEAKTLLKYSNLSVQEIAYNLNFPNQSFFGSYFKRNTGMSPSRYKVEM